MTSTGYIYVIRTSLDTSFCYIGSTFNRLSKRFEGHRNAYKYWLSNPIKYKHNYLCIFDYYTKYGIDNFDITLIKKYEVCREHVKDRKHLHVYETLWIRKTKNCVNKLLPFNPLKKLLNQIKDKKYYDNNSEMIREKHTKYYENNKQKKRDYQLKNKEKIHNRKSEKVTCDNCRTVIQRTNLTRHKKSFKCTLYKNTVPIYI